MQTLNEARNRNLDELQRHDEELESPRERACRQYVEESFKRKKASLIQFALENESVMKIAKYLLNYTTGSNATLYQYVFGVNRFCEWLKKNPDDIIREIVLDKTRIDVYIQHIDNFIGDLKAKKRAPGTVNNYVKGVKRLFRANGINLVLPHRLSKRVKYPDRSPTPEELSKVMDYANVKEKAVVSMLALSGMRLGTLVKLTYKHVRNDLEKGRIPVHIHVEAEITKGKYHAYDTFIGEEAVKSLNAYLDVRRKGTAKLPPETLTNESPLMRNECRNIVLPVSPASITSLVHKLFFKAGLIEKGEAKRYPIRPHSLRKYFRTQLGAISTIPTDYIKYMMGRTISTYNDVQMKGIEFLRNLYAQSGLSIRPKTKISKIDTLKMFVESLGLNPDEVLSKDALSMPHRTIVDPESHQIKVLNEALKNAILKELRNA